MEELEVNTTRKRKIKITPCKKCGYSKHKRRGLHPKKLAIDLNLFKHGKYLIKTEDHAFLGKFWKSLDSMCTWGGDFKRKDGNHYSYGEFNR